MTPDEYLAAIKRVPLYIERDTTDGRGYLCRDINGRPVQVDKPEHLTEEERELAVANYRLFFSPTRN